ncbi:MAG TPA: IclR family transcriptional regulator [Acidobacteriota bacterium]|jgi:DNA-binding IclR family transcriptional regulator
MKARVTVVDKGSPYRVQVLDRALGILDVLAREGSGIALVEISTQLGLHKSTVHRLLRVLERHRVVIKDSQNGRYRLGFRLFELGSQAIEQLDIRERAQPYLKNLVLQTGETAHICILDHGEMLSVANVESVRTIRTPSTVGRRTPAHCTAVGKALLAFLTDGELEDFIKKNPLKGYTGKTITSATALKAQIESVRERGYAIDDEEIEEGLRCIGAPIWDYSRSVIASMSIAGPAFRIKKEKIPALAEFVVRAARQLSAELGHQETLKIRRKPA